MARVLIGNVKPRKGVDYFTPADIQEMGKSFATTESVNNLNASIGANTENIDKLSTSLTETQETVGAMDNKFAPAYTFGTEDLEAGVTPLETGKLHFVYDA